MKEKEDKVVKRSGRRRSIRTPLMIVPIALVIVSILAIIFSVSLVTDRNMKAQMEEETEFLLANVTERLHDNQKSIEALENTTEITIEGHLATLHNEPTERLNNKRINQLTELMHIDEINVFDGDSEVIYSSIPDNVGMVFADDHPITQFNESDEQILIEDIRRNTSAGLEGSYKYGAIKNNDGLTIQVGINVDDIVALAKEFQEQNLIQGLVSDEDVVYASYINNQFESIANSDEAYLGKDMSDVPEITEAINDEKILSMYHEVDGHEVYDVVYPIIIEDENLGALRMGISLDNVNGGIRSNIMVVLAVGLIAILILVFALYRSSNEMINVVNSQLEDTTRMSEGDFTMPVPDEAQARLDEYGDMARANYRMKESVKDILNDVMERAEVVAAYSEELTATAQSSAASANQLDTVVQDIADAATSLAHDADSGFSAVQELDQAIAINNDNLVQLNDSTQTVNTLKDEGIELIRDLVDKTDQTRSSVREIGSLIDNTSTSADEISTAIGMIRNISEQTNLLALNASIEAARAGDSGSGFAVVAEEIRSLAEESDRFTEEIEKIVHDLTSKTLMAVETMSHVEEIVASQGNSVTRTDDKFEGISSSIEEINQVREQINTSNKNIETQQNELSNIMENIAAVAEENAAGTEEALASIGEQNTVSAQISETSSELAQVAEDLNESTQAFTV